MEQLIPITYHIIHTLIHICRIDAITACYLQHTYILMHVAQADPDDHLLSCT